LAGLSFCGYGLCGPLSLTGTQQIVHGAAALNDVDSDTNAFKSIGLIWVEDDVDQNGITSSVQEKEISSTIELTTRSRRRNEKSSK